MAEWGLLLHVVVVVGVAYALTRRFDGTREVVITWIVAALIITIGLGVYGASKVSRVKKSWIDQYQIEEDLR